PEAEILYGHDRFLEEVRLASGLSHPHILAFIDSGRADGLLYYVMPHVEGETLYARLARETSLSLPVVTALLHVVAASLAYAPENDIVHRDLKPGNVLCADAHAYLMDFGVAKALRKAPPGQPRTRAGFVPGTPRYMAPEQMEGRSDIGPASDVFAWGQLAHECLTGSVLPPPWSTRDDIRGSLLRARADLPGGLAEAIAHALAVDPEARPSAADLVQALEGAGGAVGTD